MIDQDYIDLISKARKAGSEKNWDEAIDYYEKAFKILILSDDLLDLGLVYLENDNSFRALKSIDTVIEAANDYYKGYYYKGIYYEYNGDSKEAVKYYKLSLDKIDSDKDALDKSEINYKIGKIYDDNDNTEEAVNYYLRAISDNSNHYYACLNLGSIYEKENKYEEAINYTQKALAINPELPLASYNLGVVYGDLGDFDLSKKYYLEEITKDGFYPYAYYNLALIAKDCDNDFEKAKMYNLKALEYLKNEANVWYNLACVYTLTNDFDNAYDCFLCAIINNNKILDFMKEDEEIKLFVQSEYYNKLVKKFNV